MLHGSHSRPVRAPATQDGVDVGRAGQDVGGDSDVDPMCLTSPWFDVTAERIDFDAVLSLPGVGLSPAVGFLFSPRAAEYVHHGVVPLVARVLE